MVANRQNSRVYAALDAVLPRIGSLEDFDSPHPDPDSVVVTQDRWCIYRPAARDDGWRTAENLHLDVNPWTYAGLKATEIETLRYGTEEFSDHRFPLQDFRAELTAVQGRGCPTGEHVQGVLNLLDNLEEDGGTRVVPGFQHSFMQWLQSLGAMEDNLSQSGQRDNWVLRRAAGGGSFKFSDLDPIHALSRRIPMRAGSFLVWNQLVVHGSCANRSNNFRMAQFITGFRAGEMSPERAWARAAAVQRLCAGLPLTPLAPHVFGFSEPSEPTRPSRLEPVSLASRERMACEHVLASARKGDAEGLLKAFEDFHLHCRPLLHVGERKGEHLDAAVRARRPARALELGSYLGYSAVRIARCLPDGAHLYSVEENCQNAMFAEASVEHAGQEAKVVVLRGTVELLKQRLLELAPFDFVFLDHQKALYLEEIQRLEAWGLIQEGTVIVADNIGGCNRADCRRVTCGCAYANYVRSSGHYHSRFYWGSRDGIEVSCALPKIPAGRAGCVVVEKSDSERDGRVAGGKTLSDAFDLRCAAGWLRLCHATECAASLSLWFRRSLWEVPDDSCVGPYVVDLAVCASACCFSAANELMEPRLRVLLKEYLRQRTLSPLEVQTFPDFMAAGALACSFYRFCEFNVRQSDADAKAKDSYKLMAQRVELLLDGPVRKAVVDALADAVGAAAAS
ncbi:COMT [Symbiodinium necroappetens]|uniref:catechol O-methyltransferase n=1 Tax=Symbiodinium necroappetens TaxID=1628268 RepID=A0A812PE03_9DINO|nr:COMT [Symbiodinium necroappetens]